MPSENAAGLRARLFDADQPDRLLQQEELAAQLPTERQLLWIDLSGSLGPDILALLPAHLRLSRRTLDALQESILEPSVTLHGNYLHVRVAAEPNDRDDQNRGWLDLIAGPNLLISRHDRPVEFLDAVDQRIRGDAASGILTSAAFLTVIVDAVITSYHLAVDDIEADVDRLDAASLRGSATDELLGDLVRCRRRIARLRSQLADHRAAFTALAAPDIAQLVDDPDSVTLLQGLTARYEGALRAVEDSREALLGSFDVLMSRTAQRTNEVMKVLTIATVLLLPGSVIAGLLGMNVVVPLNADDPMSFWLVVVAFAVLIVAALVVARIKRWI